ncbi:transmembrane protein 116 [Ambystoma mexicanum]|uniref:transmembrane protein 116 n=1 Tax=Ambystoma mexicanum TaxID=8296 RepID=UPI0037E8F918
MEMDVGSWRVSAPAVFAYAAEDGKWTPVYTALQWIQFVTATLSIIGSSSLIAYAVFQRSVKTPEMRPLFYLSASDLILGFCWLMGAALFNTELKTPHNVACYNLQTTGQIFYMSSFFYTANYTWRLFTDLKNKIHNWESTYPGLLSRMAIVLSSCLPIILMIPVFAIGNSHGCYQNYSQPHSHRCLLLHNAVAINVSASQGFSSPLCTAVHFYGLGAFLVTFLTAAIIILVLLSRACAMHRKYVQTSGTSDDHRSILISVAERRAAMYPCVFFYCWAPAVILGIVKLFYFEEHTTFYMILYVLQAFTATSQGLLNCLVYGWTQNFYRYLKQRSCHDAGTQTPLLRSEKKRLYHSTQLTTGNVDGVTNTVI